VNSTSCEIPYYVIFSDPMLSHLSFTRSVQVKIFWVVTPCGVVGRYQRSRGPPIFSAALKMGAASRPRRTRLNYPLMNFVTFIFESVN